MIDPVIHGLSNEQCYELAKNDRVDSQPPRRHILKNNLERIDECAMRQRRPSL